MEHESDGDSSFFSTLNTVIKGLLKELENVGIKDK